MLIDANRRLHAADVPFEDDSANRYWLTPTGDKLGYDPNVRFPYNSLEVRQSDLQLLRGRHAVEVSTHQCIATNASKCTDTHLATAARGFSCKLHWPQPPTKA